MPALVEDATTHAFNAKGTQTMLPPEAMVNANTILVEFPRVEDVRYVRGYTVDAGKRDRQELGIFQ